MAKQIFKQFQQVVSGYTDFQNGILYFVRTSATREDGFLYFNGKKYGTAKDVEDALKKLLGDLPEGETSFASWIDKISTSLTIESAARIAGDNAIIGDSAATTTGQTTLYDLRRAVDSFSGSSHTHQNIDVLNGITAEKVAAWDAAEQNAKDYADSAITGLDATVSGESNGVSVEIAEVDGKLTGVTVTAPNFGELYDGKGAADAAFSAATADTTEQIATAIAAETARTEGAYVKVEALDAYYTSAQTESAIETAVEALDATVSGQSSEGVKVEIEEVNGKLTSVTVTGPDLSAVYDEKGAAASAETNANAYTDDVVSGLDATVSGESAQGVSVTIEQEDGKLKSVTVAGPDLSAVYDEKGAAASAFTSAQTYTNEVVSGLDATISGESNGVSVEIAEVDGKLTGVTVIAPNFDAKYDALGAAASAETSAKSYADGLIGAETARTESTYAKPADITSAIEALSASSVSVSASETVASVSEANGVVSVTKQNIAISHSAVTDWDTELAKKQDALTFNSTPTSENWVATRADIADIAGAMHFVGTSTTDPTDGGPTISGHTGAFVAGDVCLYGTKEFIYNGTDWVEIGDEGLYVTKTTTIAGVDLQDNITKAELLSALTVEEGAQVNVIETVKVNGTALTVTDKAVDVLIAEGSSAGTISVNNVDVPVHGLGSMAFEDAANFAAASSLTALSGSVESAITELEGEIDTASAATYNAATANTASQIEALDATVTGSSSGTTVVVTEADGVITNVSVENHISSDSDNALEMKSDGFFAAIYYEDNDPVV